MDGYTPGMHTRARQYAGVDPAIDEDDLLQTGYLKTLGHAFVSELHRRHTLAVAITQAGLDVARRRRRLCVPFDAEYHGGSRDAEDEALADLALGEALDDGSAGARLAVAMGCGYSRREVAAAAGVPDGTVAGWVWRWRVAQGGVAR